MDGSWGSIISSKRILPQQLNLFIALGLSFQWNKNSFGYKSHHQYVEMKSYALLIINPSRQFS